MPEASAWSAVPVCWGGGGRRLRGGRGFGVLADEGRHLVGVIVALRVDLREVGGEAAGVEESVDGVEGEAEGCDGAECGGLGGGGGGGLPGEHVAFPLGLLDELFGGLVVGDEAECLAERRLELSRASCAAWSARVR